MKQEVNSDLANRLTKSAYQLSDLILHFLVGLIHTKRETMTWGCGVTGSYAHILWMLTLTFWRSNMTTRLHEVTSTSPKISLAHKPPTSVRNILLILCWNYIQVSYSIKCSVTAGIFIHWSMYRPWLNMSAESKQFYKQAKHLTNRSRRCPEAFHLLLICLFV